MSIKKNFLYSLVLTTANYVFPLLVFPYVSRVLGVNGIGICNFIDSIINYFVLFSTMGISIIGIREIASVKENSDVLNTRFTSLLLHTAVPTILSSVVFLLAFIYVPQLSEYREFIFIGIAKILGSAFAIDWFYKGIEDFRYITLRTIIVKLLYVASIFIFVRDAEDYLIYFWLTALMIIVNSIVNLNYCRKFIHLQYNIFDFKSLINPNLINGFYLFLNTMYSSLNVTFLGFVSTTVQVGYYTTANKIFGIILSVYGAFTGVLLPRMSALASERKDDEFKRLITKSINFLVTFTIPVVIVCIILAPDIINVISGAGYEGAYLPARIAMPLIFIVGYEQILVVQIITPLKEDRIKFINSVVGATVGVVLSLLLVKNFLAVGATIVWFCSEISVLMMAQYFVKKKIGMSFPAIMIIKEIVVYIPLAFAVYFLYTYHLNSFITLLIAFVVSGVYFTMVNILIFKNGMITSLLKLKK